MTRTFDSGDALVDDALAQLATADPTQAMNAEAAFGSLTWGNGLSTVSLRGLQEFLWYQLPTKWAVPPEELHEIAAALGALFQLLHLPRYAAACTSELTATVIDAYADGTDRDAGIAAYRKALDGGGVEPPTIPGLLTWSGVLGAEEHSAFWALAEHLELAMADGVYTPGRRGWRTTMVEVSRTYLTTVRDLGSGDRASWLTLIQTERRGRWAESRSPGRAALTAAVLPLITEAPAVPPDAEERLAPIRWLLGHAAGDGVPLTVNHTLGRAVLTEGCLRFNWFMNGSQAPPENQLLEAISLRSMLRDLGATRRRGRRLLLTPAGQELLDADTETLWTRVSGALIPTDPAHAAAAEALLMILLTKGPPDYRSTAVADILTQQGWRTGSDIGVSETAAAWLTGELSGRLDLLGLTDHGTLTHRSSLTPTGRNAALTALHRRAHAPRDRL